MENKQLQSWERPDYALAPAPAAEEAKPSKSVADILWQRRYTGAAVAAAVLALAGAYAFLATKKWKSTASLKIDTSSQLPLGQAMAPPLYKEKLQTEAELLASEPTLAKTLALPQIKHMRMFRGVRDPVATLERALKVHVRHDTTVIRVSLISPYNHENARLINALMHTYLASQDNAATGSAEHILKVYRQQEAATTARLKKDLAAMVRFKQTHAVMSFKDNKGNIQVQRLAALSKALTQAQLKAIEATSRYNAAAQLKSYRAVRRFAQMQRTQVVTSSADVEREQLKGQLASLEARRAGLRRDYSAGEHALRPLDASIREVRRELARLDRNFAKSYLSVLQQQQSEAIAKAAAIRAIFKKQKAAAMALTASAAEYGRLQGDYRQLRKQRDALDTKIRDAQVAADSGLMNMQVWESAKPARVPYSPNKAEDLVLGLFLGIMLGGAAALAQEARDEYMHSAEEIRRALGLPLLGVIPHIGGWWSQRNRGRRTMHDAQSEIAEAFRSLRISVYGGFRPLIFKTILMTSPEKGDGKSVCVSNFAIAVAKSRRRVLIIDADLRAPSQHRIFGISNEVGLCDVLEQAATLEESIFHTEVENLDLLPAGSLPENPVDLLASPNFAELLRTLASRYDCVLLDSPPVTPVADARVLAEIADGVVMVLRANRSLRKASRHACAMLNAAQSELWGIVVNDSPRGTQRYGFHGGYKSRQRVPLRRQTPVESVVLRNVAAPRQEHLLPERQPAAPPAANGSRRGLTAIFS